MQDVNDFTPHSTKQEQALFSDKRFLVLATGTQFGKTTVGAIRMKFKNHTYTNKDDHFIITSPNYKTLMQSTILPYLKIMDGFGRYNKVEQMFEIHNGGRVFFRTETDPDSIVGITNVRHIWGDEAGKYRLYFWENMQARADFLGCGIDLTTSPYSRNWVYKDLIKPTIQNKRDDVELIQAASWDNPYHFLNDPVKRKEKMATMDRRRFDMLYGGEWGQMSGLVYDCWHEEENQCDAFQLPVGTKYYGGIDWGYNPDPFCLKIRAITPEGRHYGVSEFYKTKMEFQDIVNICREKKSIFNVQSFYCDPSQPGYIASLQSNGIPCLPADNDIAKGIAVHYELLKTRKMKYFKGLNPYTLDEIELYHYPDTEDLGPDENAKVTKPVDQNNHAMDTDRYISIMTVRSHLVKPPRVPIEGGNTANETFEQRIKRLTKMKNSSKYETWE